MPVSSKVVGKQSKRFRHVADRRWTMAYAAGLNDTNPSYFRFEKDKVEQAQGARVHPVFPVAIEWPVVLDIRHLEGMDSVSREEAARGVHASHDLRFQRPMKPDEVLFTQATVIGVEARRAGAYLVMRLDTRDESGELVCSTWQGSLYRGVAVQGGDRWQEALPDLPAPSIHEGSKEWDLERSIDVTAGAAHVYTECARIWNPIHTDRAVALAAGLPNIILHGTATMALAVSELVNGPLGGDTVALKRLAGRFSAMVLMPSVLTLQANQTADGFDFQVLNAAGEVAIARGFAGVR